MPLTRTLHLIVAVLALLLIAGCGSSHLIGDVSVRPQVISPNADGDADVAEVHYSVSRQANVSIYLVDQEGGRHDLRVNERRSKGERTIYFGGVIDGRLLPDGDYRIIFEAVDTRGRTDAAEASITLQGGDSVPLRIENLSVYPTSFTPNRDGIGDRVSIGYNLSKEVVRVDVYLLGADGTKYPVPEDKIREVGAPGHA